jgi:integral membrane protein
MIKAFRLISLLEGLSYIAILSVTLGFISRDHVSTLGMTHGILFMIYLMLAMSVSSDKKWPSWKLGLVILASLVPFAFIPAEVFLRKVENEVVEEQETVV